MKKPLAVWAAEAGLVLTIFGYAGLATRCLKLFTQTGAEPLRLVPGLLIGIALALLAVFLLLRTRDQNTTRRHLSLFFWGVLVLYPLTNLLGSLGYYPLPVRVAPQEAAGAALVEILRYLLLLALIVWLGFSRKAAEFVAARRVPVITPNAPAATATAASPENP